MTEFLLIAFAAGAVTALAAAPLGSFVVWRRMAYFGDTLAHSGLLGVGLALVLSWNPMAGIAVSSCLIALLLWFMQQSTNLATDSLLGILSHSALAVGLVVVSLFSDTRVDLYSYLFGDLLTVTPADLAIIAGVALAVTAVVIALWRPLLMIAVDEDLAQAEGLPVAKLRLVLMVLIAVLIAVAMKTVGILLITALLIIPPAASRRLTRSPEAMAALAGLLGILAVVGGLASSWFWDTPPGPSIVLCTTLFFALCGLLGRRRQG